MRRFAAGEAVVWRSVHPRRREIGQVHANVAVRDDEIVALYRGPGAPYKRRTGGRGGPGDRMFLHWDGGYEDRVWGGRHALILHTRVPHTPCGCSGKPPTGRWSAGTSTCRPWRRTPIGFGSLDLVLDAVVAPDRSSWYWKDEDELAWAVEQGRYTVDEVAAMRTEGERAVSRILAGSAPFDGSWESWRPDPAWHVSVLPDTWKQYEPA
ncbi:MAG: hypothetical protein ACRDF0_03565 [Candidatus Limnocylindria bacterium]